MTQFARPTSDAHVGNWSRQDSAITNLYQSIDEQYPNDADYIQSEIPLTATPSPVAFQLGALDTPGSRYGHVLTIRARRVGTPGISLVVELRQDYLSEASQGTLIASTTVTTLDSTTINVSLYITPAEAAQITDYGALAVRITAAI